MAYLDWKRHRNWHGASLITLGASFYASPGSSLVVHNEFQLPKTFYSRACSKRYVVTAANKIAFRHSTLSIVVTKWGKNWFYFVGFNAEKVVLLGKLVSNVLQQILYTLHYTDQSASCKNYPVSWGLRIDNWHLKGIEVSKIRNHTTTNIMLFTHQVRKGFNDIGWRVLAWANYWISFRFLLRNQTIPNFRIDAKGFVKESL